MIDEIARDCDIKNETERLLRVCLRTAVPLWVDRIRTYSEGQLRSLPKRCVDIVAYKGDRLLYGGGKKGDTAEVFNRLAEGIEYLALAAKGGVTVFGLHFDYEWK